MEAMNEKPPRRTRSSDQVTKFKALRGAAWVPWPDVEQAQDDGCHPYPSKHAEVSVPVPGLHRKESWQNLHRPHPCHSGGPEPEVVGNQRLMNPKP